MSEQDFMDSLAASGKLAELAEPAEPEDEGLPAAEAEPEPEPEAAAEEAAEAEKLYAGRYKSVEEMERGVKELEQRFGAQGSELGELRAKAQELEARLSQQEQPRYDRGELGEWLDENALQVPQIAEVARVNGDASLYDAAMEKWHELSPRQAAAYERRIELAQLEQRMAAQTNAQVAPAQQLAARDAQQAAAQQLAAEHEDFGQLMAGLDEQKLGEIIAHPEFPREILEGAVPGDVASQRKVLGTLYRWVKSDQTGMISEVAQAAARTATEETRKAKLAGTLPSSATTAPAVDAPDGVAQFKGAFREALGLPPLNAA